MSKIIEGAGLSSPSWPTLEAIVRAQVQQCLQRVLEEEVDQLLGRAKSVRRGAETAGGYRNGHGKPRQLA